MFTWEVWDDLECNHVEPNGEQIVAQDIFIKVRNKAIEDGLIDIDERLWPIWGSPWTPTSFLARLKGKVNERTRDTGTIEGKDQCQSG